MEALSHKNFKQDIKIFATGCHIFILGPLALRHYLSIVLPVF